MEKWQDKFDKKFYGDEGWLIDMQNGGDSGSGIKRFIQGLLNAKDKQFLEVLEGMFLKTKEEYSEFLSPSEQTAFFSTFGYRVYQEFLYEKLKKEKEDQAKINLDQAKQKLLSNDDENTH